MSRESFDQLLDAMIPFAQEMLEKHREYHPFAMALTEEGDVGAVSVDQEEEFPAPEMVVKQLQDALREGAPQNRFVATGICVNVRIHDPQTGKASDAIHILLEELNGPPGEVVLPYNFKKNGQLDFGELMAKPGKSIIFPRKP